MADPSICPPLTRSSVIAAHALIKEHIHFTPVLTNRTITDLASTPQTVDALIGTPWEGQRPAEPKIRIWFKCENLQRVGAFKVRGAFHAVKRMMGEDEWEERGGRERGVVTHSSGNHAQALALAAKTMGIPARIVMPTISTPLKIAATRGYGAEITFSGSTSVEREEVVKEVQGKTGARLIPPYDHPDIILGQGTLGWEMQGQVEEMIARGRGSGGRQVVCSFARGKKSGEGGEEEKEKGEEHRKEKKRKGLDAIIAPCGGGGMLSGIALSCENTTIRVFGAEPSFQGADDCTRGFASGNRITSVSSLTIADGLRTPVGVYPWSIIYERKLVKGMYSVTDEQILKAMRLVYERMKVVVEPSAVVGLAVALFHEGFRRMVKSEGGEDGWDVGVVFSGGNVGLEALGALFGRADRQEDGKGEKSEKEDEQAREMGKIGVDGKRVAENVAG